ncbi:hypothetical protein [Luteibacter yeojuensis]|uniref:Uncharacterized protein n=1 Tax=Luteibacter yeojuensis TaxID=345309 RepID=A0A7X5TPK6_9GAMM|nr:hypothetical protein [Luteibacter yeojuensis]NID14824.1 hypothetical protein [Luteibacter yeojuensis]
MSPRFGKTAIRPPYRHPFLKSAKETAATRRQDMRLAEVMKRLCVTLKKALTPAINGNLYQREKDIAKVLDRIRLHNLDVDKPKPQVATPYKPFRSQA